MGSSISFRESSTVLERELIGVHRKMQIEGDYQKTMSDFNLCKDSIVGLDIWIVVWVTQTKNKHPNHHYLIMFSKIAQLLALTVLLSSDWPHVL